MDRIRALSTDLITQTQGVVSVPIDASIDSLHVDAIESSLELSGIETDVFETFLSRPADKINLPEVIDAKATFIYNYYTRDERVREGTSDLKDRILSLDASLTDEIFYQVKNKKTPRYVKIKIKPPLLSYTLDVNS